MDVKELRSRNRETTELFHSWNNYLCDYGRNINKDVLLKTTKHAKERQKSRNVTTGQLLHVLSRPFLLQHIQKSTREHIYKFRVDGKDFDNKAITVVFVVGPMLYNRGIKQHGCKIITMFCAERHNTLEEL